MLFSCHILFHCFFFFFNDTATTEIYTLSLHDALPISSASSSRSSTGVTTRLSPAATSGFAAIAWRSSRRTMRIPPGGKIDRKSTRLNSSHVEISYAVFCLKKKKKKNKRIKSQDTNK